MSDTTTNQVENAAKEAEQSATAVAKPNTSADADSSSKQTEQGTDSGNQQEQLQQTGPGPKVLRSHYRGMPNQWEKNLHPKKEE